MTDPDDRGVRIQLLVASQHPRSRVQPLIGTRGVHFQLGRQPRSELIGPVRATTSQLHRRLLAHFRTDRVWSAAPIGHRLEMNTPWQCCWGHDSRVTYSNAAKKKKKVSNTSANSCDSTMHYFGWEAHTSVDHARVHDDGMPDACAQLTVFHASAPTCKAIFYTAYSSTTFFSIFFFFFWAPKSWMWENRIG